VLKLHPRENAADYQFCERLDPPVRVIPTADVSELIGACDLFVSSSSSTVLLAMMLDRPIVTVNFNEVPHFDYFESVGGTLHTRSPGEFAAAVRLALEDPATRELLARQRADVLARYTRFDGGATQRLAAIIANAHAPDAVRSPA
jgi:CDP-glycerol glycerophosphotransferase (TagB/SpsB family)